MTTFKNCIGGALLIGMLALAACGPAAPAAQPALQTPALQTPAPQTPALQTPAPQTPALQTPALQEGAPLNPAPVDPTPVDLLPTPAPAVDASTLPPAALEARQQLASKLAIDPQSVSVLSVEATDWPDSCLGAEQPGEMCAAVITPGYKIVLDASGERYVLHTNDDGSNFRVVESPEQ